MRISDWSSDVCSSDPSPVAEHVEIHEHVMDGNAMRMRPVDGVPLPAGGMAELQPGGYHVMLIGLKHPLKQGEHFPLTLTFEKAGTVTIEVPVLRDRKRDV